MRNNSIVIVVSIFLLFFCACQEDVENAGASTLSEVDEIRVESDTFKIVSSLDSCLSISMTPDSFLLGECDTHFGLIKADILTQLACPEGFEYPNIESAEVDSVYLYLYYREWYGDGNAPVGITVYEMDCNTIDLNTSYPSDVALTDFCSLHDSVVIAAQSKIIIPSVVTDSVYDAGIEKYVPYIPIKLSDSFAKRFFDIKTFESQSAFNTVFKGLYICSDFGGSTVLYVTDISMTVFYHFSMQRPTVGDTIIHDVKSFYANEEVRQINRFIYPERESVLNHYVSVADTNYIVSPANLCTRLEIGMDSIYHRIETQLGTQENYRVYVNKADLVIDVLYTDSTTNRPRDNWDLPASNMLLIKEDCYDSFFSKNELPNDTSALLANLNTNADSLNNITYTYTYDMSKLLTQQLRAQQRIDKLNFILVPVAVSTNASNSITGVKQLQTISVTRIRSSKNIKPINIEMVYSGFHLSK